MLRLRNSALSSTKLSKNIQANRFLVRLLSQVRLFGNYGFLLSTNCLTISQRFLRFLLEYYKVICKKKKKRKDEAFKTPSSSSLIEHIKRKRLRLLKIKIVRVHFHLNTLMHGECSTYTGSNYLYCTNL